MSRILVTGSRGTLGTALVKELRRRGHTVFGCDLAHSSDDNYFRVDVGEYREVRDMFATKVDFVYHLAAEFGRLNGEQFYERLWRTNVIGTRNILEIQKRQEFGLIFASSSEVYGDVAATSLTEELTEEQPIQHRNDYAMTKWVNEVQIMNFEQRYGNRCVRLRFFNAYGPGEHYHRCRSVVCLFCYSALHGIPYEVYEGYHRVFMFINDFTPTLASVCDKFHAGSVYNIGGAEYRSVRELSDLIQSLTNQHTDLATYLPEDKHNVVNKRPDITKAQQTFGHNPTTTLEDGIPATIQWMQQVYGCH